MQTAVSLAIIVIGVFALLKVIAWLIDFTTIYLRVLEIEKTRDQWKKAEAEEKIQREKNRAIAAKLEERELKRQARLAEGLTEVGQGHHEQLFLKLDDTGFPIALYNLDGKRVPLATLAKLPGANVVGVIPTIYYHNHKLDQFTCRRDELEIAKLQQ